MNEKLRELIAKWRDEAAKHRCIAKEHARTHAPKADQYETMAEELEAGIAESGTEQAIFPPLSKYELNLIRQLRAAASPNTAPADLVGVPKRELGKETGIFANLVPLTKEPIKQFDAKRFVEEFWQKAADYAGEIELAQVAYAAGQVASGAKLLTKQRALDLTRSYLYGAMGLYR